MILRTDRNAESPPHDWLERVADRDADVDVDVMHIVQYDILSKDDLMILHDWTRRDATQQPSRVELAMSSLETRSGLSWFFMRSFWALYCTALHCFSFKVHSWCVEWYHATPIPILVLVLVLVNWTVVWKRTRILCRRLLKQRRVNWRTCFYPFKINYQCRGGIAWTEKWE